ncbi:hypothetical protein [Caballeronia insecticola]|uniref:hypothetical protein n=1 Tax=Caballeronia insecticola TaxID=758793 RepID=UPI0011824FCB|nr:hypothetical protein [Caballeronia insecticola]
MHKLNGYRSPKCLPRALTQSIDFASLFAIRHSGSRTLPATITSVCGLIEANFGRAGLIHFKRWRKRFIPAAPDARISYGLKKKLLRFSSKQPFVLVRRQLAT